MCCSVLQCVAVCGSVLQCVVVCGSVLQRVAACSKYTYVHILNSLGFSIVLMGCVCVFENWRETDR